MATTAADISLKGTTIKAQYEIEALLGEGSYGKVYLVNDKKTKDIANKKKALKMMIFGTLQWNEFDMNGTMIEADLQRKLHHPNIVKYYESFFCVGKYYICTEYCEEGDLDAKIKSYKDRREHIKEDLIMWWIIQLILGVQHIHQNGILHRDIKTRNIFIRNNIVKIGDFGISRLLMDNCLANTCIGTPFYMSPEVVEHSGYNSKSDIWSIGCVLFESVALKPAYEGPSMFAVFRRISQVELPKWPKEYSRELQDVFAWNPFVRKESWESKGEPRPDNVRSTQTKDYSKRPSAADLLGHSYIQSKLQLFKEELEQVMKETATLCTNQSSLDTSTPQDARQKLNNDREKAYQDFQKFKKERTSKRRVSITIFHAEIDNATSQDIDNILRMMSNQTLTDSQTLTEDQEHGAWGAKARAVKISIYKQEMMKTLGESQFHKAYMWLKTNRGKPSMSESDIQRGLEQYIAEERYREQMDNLIFLETHK